MGQEKIEGNASDKISKTSLTRRTVLSGAAAEDFLATDIGAEQLRPQDIGDRPGERVRLRLLGAWHGLRGVSGRTVL